jgi:hypothetical protein
VFKKIHSIQQRICIGDEIVAAGESLRASGTIGEDEWRNYSGLAMGFKRKKQQHILFPLASAGAIEGHIEQSFEEQGMSCLK